MRQRSRALESVMLLVGFCLTPALPASARTAAPGQNVAGIAFGALASELQAADPLDDARPRRAMISFSGYQRLPQGRGRLFIHLSARPELMVLEKGGTEHRYRLVDTDIGVRNNRHPLDLREFDDLLLRSQLTPNGDDVVLTLRLRRAAEPTYEFVELEDGRVSLQIDLPRR